MRAAVVTSFDTAPKYQNFPAPIPQTPNEVVVDVIASGLHPRVRSQANGSHYTSTDELPLVPGFDGVGRAPDGSLHYFILSDTTMGTMAQQTVIDRRRSIELPDDCDPVLIAAGMNPAMSAWVALRRRITFAAGQRVLVLGATGNAGRMAVQVAKHFGASHIVGAGRDPDRLASLLELGADATVSLQGTSDDVARAFAHAAGNVDVVIDYVWGEATVDAMVAIVTHRTNQEQPLTWIEIGSVGGSAAALPSAALRSIPLQIVGSGQGSVPASDFLAELPELSVALSDGTLEVNARPVPLSDVEAAWADNDGSQRIVIMP